MKKYLFYFIFLYYTFNVFATNETQINNIFSDLVRESEMYKNGTVGFYIGCSVCQAWTNITSKIITSSKKTYVDLRLKEYQEIIDIITNNNLSNEDKIYMVCCSISQMKIVNAFKNDSFFIASLKNLKEKMAICSNLALSYEDSPECIICFDNFSSILFSPCGHYSCCTECSTNLEKCHICRKKIKSKTYLPFINLCLECKTEESEYFCKNTKKLLCSDCCTKKQDCQKIYF